MKWFLTSQFGLAALLLLLLFLFPQLTHFQVKCCLPCQEVFDGDHRALERHLRKRRPLDWRAVPRSGNCYRDLPRYRYGRCTVSFTFSASSASFSFRRFSSSILFFITSTISLSFSWTAVTKVKIITIPRFSSTCRDQTDAVTDTFKRSE